MKLKNHLHHPWDLQPEDAVALQTSLAQKVNQRSSIKFADIKTVAGLDTHYHKSMATAAVVVFNVSELRAVESATVVRSVEYPYIPGLLSFREGPVLLDALNKLKSSPDVLIFDGQGIAHPRRFGIASHIGVLVDIPSIGCAKSALSGQYDEPGMGKGNYSYLIDRGETIGAAVRTRRGVKPVYVSVGNRVDLQDSIHIVLTCCRGYRLPEPIRRADSLARDRSMSTHLTSPDT